MWEKRKDQAHRIAVGKTEGFDRFAIRQRDRAGSQFGRAARPGSEHIFPSLFLCVPFARKRSAVNRTPPSCPLWPVHFFGVLPIFVILFLFRFTFSAFYRQIATTNRKILLIFGRKYDIISVVPVRPLSQLLRTTGRFRCPSCRQVRQLFERARPNCVPYS